MARISAATVVSDVPVDSRQHTRRLVKCGLLSGGLWQPTRRRFSGGGRLLCAQCGGNAADYLPTEEHTEMADAIDGDGLRLGVEGHRS